MTHPTSPNDDVAYQHLQNELARLTLLYDVSQQLATATNLRTVLQHILSATTHYTNATRGSILLFDDRGGVLMNLLSEQFQENIPTDFTNLVLREGLASWVLQHEQSALVRDTALDPRWIDYPSTTLDVRSAVCVPLIRPKRVRGVLTLVHPEIGAFSSEDETMLNLIANHAAIAIENARLLGDVSDERRKLEGVLNAMNDGLLLVDRSARIHYINPSAFSLLQLSDNIAQTLDLLAPDLYVSFAQTLETGEDWHGELTINRVNRFDLAVTIAYSTILSDENDWWTIVLHDITPSKEYDRLKNQFIANTSHDLRTPLANIKLYARLAQQQSIQHAPQYLETIASEAERLESLVENVLTLARIDSGLLYIERELTNINTLVEKIVETYRPLAENQQQTLLVQTRDVENPWTMLAQDVFIRVIVNILSNALKFTPSHGNITVETQSLTEGLRAGIQIAVRDTGPGITDEELPYLFERFFRGSQQSRSGSGLGLPISRELVLLLDGTLRVETSVGSGTTVYCWIPLDPA